MLLNHDGAARHHERAGRLYPPAIQRSVSVLTGRSS
jgi:hypothetical protein